MFRSWVWCGSKTAILNIYSVQWFGLVLCGCNTANSNIFENQWLGLVCNTACEIIYSLRCLGLAATQLFLNIHSVQCSGLVWCGYNTANSNVFESQWLGLVWLQYSQIEDIWSTVVGFGVVSTQLVRIYIQCSGWVWCGSYTAIW